MTFDDDALDEWQRIGGAAPNPEPAQRSGVQRQSELILTTLTALGYTFRLNLCTMQIEVCGEPLTDMLAAEIRARVRDAGLRNTKAVEDVYAMEARRQAYHPVREWLDGLTWDGTDYIALVAEKLHCDNGNVAYADGEWPIQRVFLHRWLVGAVNRMYTGEQNMMLVVDGPQGCGKSAFARWLCPLPTYFCEGPIRPDDKDHVIRVMSKLVWEVSELDATTRKADVAALKDFITREVVSVRKSYGRHEITAPAMCNFVGTVNNTTGFLADETGNRRFMTFHVTGIDWSYRSIDASQLWAQARDLWRAGERGALLPNESAAQRAINEQYEAETPVADWLGQYFRVSADDDQYLTTGEVIAYLAEKGYRLSGTERMQQMEISRLLQRMGARRDRTRVNGVLTRVWRGLIKKGV